MRALIATVSGYGHLHPLLPLARSLADAGHEVAVASGSELSDRARAAGFDAFTAGISVPVAFQRLAERFPDREYDRLEPAEIMGWYLPHLFGEVFAPAMLDDLAPLVRSWRPDLLVHDSWEFASPIAAAAAGIPNVSQTLGLRHEEGILEAVSAALAPLWRRQGLEPSPAAGLYRHLCLDTTPPSLQARDEEGNGSRIRPLRPVPQPPVPGERLPAWMEGRRQAPLVYMTLGTNTNQDLSVFRTVIDGMTDLDADLLITTGFGLDPASIGTTAASVHVEDYVPQSLLLPHCSAVICHGGAGTVLASLAQGLPLLVLPQGADQYVIGDRVAAAGAGIVLPPSEVSPAAVRAGVLALLQEPPLRAGARRVQEEIAAMPGPDEAVHLVEAVADGRGSPVA